MGDRLTDESQSRRFQEIALPHIDAAYNLARWLARNDDDAQDIVQEAYLRAFKSFAGFRGASGRPWLLAIVRNTCYDWLRRHRSSEFSDTFDEELHSADQRPTPEDLLIERVDRLRLRDALETLPLLWREVLILREFEGLSYKEIADVAGIKVGTVMSRLARARKQLLLVLGSGAKEND